MNKKILKLLENTYGCLIFALLSGVAYFLFLFKFIVDLSAGQSLLALWFSPVIICGAATVIIKLIRQARESENERFIVYIFWGHIFLLCAGILTFVSQ